MVLYGMAWHGMAWHGMVWYGMVWYGIYTVAKIQLKKGGGKLCEFPKYLF